MHAVLRCGLDPQRRLGVEVPGALAAHDQVTIPLLAQPLEAVLGRDAAVHHHHGGARGLERFEHLGERVMLAHVAGEHLRAAHEAAGVEHQPQGEQRAIGTLVLGVSAQRLGLAAHLALEVGVGQVVQRDGGMQVEQIHRPVEQMVLDGLSVGHQGIGGAIELHQLQGLEVHPQQLAKGASFPEPTPGGALRTGARHARDNRADGASAKRWPNPELVQPGAQPQLVHRPQRDVLDPDRAGADEFQRVHIDVLNVSWLRGALDDAEIVVPSEELGGDVLGMGFERRCAPGGQLHLSAEQFVDPPAKRRPIALGDLEVSSQIEQGSLPDLGADAFGAHEPVREVGLAGGGGAGLGAPDEHEREGSGGWRSTQYRKNILWHYIARPQPPINELCEEMSNNHPRFLRISEKNVKDGLTHLINIMSSTLFLSRRYSAKASTTTFASTSPACSAAFARARSVCR